jgi:drug/metabolite transporter (DMT)-like permease
MVFCTSCAAVLLAVKPSFFPAITDPICKITLDADFCLKSCLPIALVFAVSLVLGNVAYAHLGIAFIQMIKESNLIWVYAMAVLCAMEKFSLRNSQVVGCAIFAMSLTVKGELDFQVVGFFIQLSAVLCEAVKIVLQGFILQGKKVDPLSYVLLVSPFCGVILLGTLLAIMAAPAGMAPQDLALPSMAAIRQWSPWLLANCCVAFCLNVSIAVTIKYTGPMSYLMCQLLKDVLAVLVGIFVLGEVCSAMQSLGFLLQIGCVTTWSLLKSNPERFEAGIIAGLHATIVGIFRPPELPDVKVPETDPAPAKV